jgi:hypothetical protein
MLAFPGVLSAVRPAAAIRRPIIQGTPDETRQKSMSKLNDPPRGILDGLIAAGRIENRGARPSQSPVRQIPTSDPGGILNSLFKSGLVKNFGARQKNPKRVAAALRQHANARRAKRIAKEALRPPSAPSQRHRRPGPKPIGERKYDQIVLCMLAAHWYSGGDLCRAAGFDLGERGYLMRSMLADALVTRAPNPAAGNGTPTRPEPQWLYRLTPKGEHLRELCRLLA